jgi:2-methylcitrate dehydratase PrpD
MNANSPTPDASGPEAVAHHLQALCQWASTLELRDIATSAQLKAALVLGDNIAAMLSAADEPEVRAYHQRLMASDGGGRATLFREGGPRLSLMNAALGNGLASTWNELDDGYTRTAVHPGALSQPLILAAGQDKQHAFAEVLRATVVAYEVGTRFARAWPGTLPRIHPHGAYNAVCAAAGLASLRRLDAETFMAALTAAATLVSPGPYSHAIEGALVRNAWPAAGAWLGAFACDMAELGIGGTPGSAHDVYQLILGAPTSLASELSAELGQQWTVADGYHKLYGACHHAHAAMEALESILQAQPGVRGGQDVQELTVHCSKMAMNFGNAAPRTTLAAKFSIPHAMAATLAYGADAPGNFLDPSLADPAISALRPKVRLAELPDIQPWPHDRPAKVTLRLKDGRQFEQRCEAALGSPARPLEAEAVLAKIAQLSRSRAPGLHDAVVRLRQHLAEDRLDALDFGQWMDSFYR